MPTKEILEAQDFIVEHWGESGKRVVIETRKASEYYGITFTEFLDNCVSFGGNWGGMILSGIHELWPNVFDVIPDNMGRFAFMCLCYTIVLCGVDTTK